MDYDLCKWYLGVRLDFGLRSKGPGAPLTQRVMAVCGGQPLRDNFIKLT